MEKEIDKLDNLGKDLRKLGKELELKEELERKKRITFERRFEQMFSQLLKLTSIVDKEQNYGRDQIIETEKEQPIMQQKEKIAESQKEQPIDEMMALEAAKSLEQQTAKTVMRLEEEATPSQQEQRREHKMKKEETHSKKVTTAAEVANPSQCQRAESTAQPGEKRDKRQQTEQEKSKTVLLDSQETDIRITRDWQTSLFGETV